MADRITDEFLEKVMTALRAAMAAAPRLPFTNLALIYWFMPEIHPHTDGPLSWQTWHGPEPPPFGADKVRRALAQLEKQGRVEAVRDRGLQTLYRAVD